MNRFLKSREHFMKCLGFVLLFVFISLGAIGGCNSDGSHLFPDTQALTENDFAEDPVIFVNPTRGVVVTFLEDDDGEEEDNDTGGVGVDIIPYSYDETVTHTFCWEDDTNDEDELFMILFDSDGNEVLRVEANGECVTQIIEAGDYEMHINRSDCQAPEFRSTFRVINFHIFV